MSEKVRAYWALLEKVFGATCKFCGRTTEDTSDWVGVSTVEESYWICPTCLWVEPEEHDGDEEAN